VFVGSHVCLPIALAYVANTVSVLRRGQALYSGREILLLGLAGLLPDLLDPHLFLTDRFGSWTHNAWFPAGVLVVMLAAWACRVVKNPRMIFGFPAAVALHIGCDAITGGVRLFPPYDHMVGRYYIASTHWLLLDAISITVTLATYAFFTWTNNRQGRPDLR
jgi:hypothetical protein